MNSKKKLLEHISEFLNNSYKKESAAAEIFSILNKILHFQTGSISYLNNGSDTPAYEFEKHQNSSSSCNNKLTEELLINKCAFAILEISDCLPYTQEEKETFKICASIISNIIRGIELSEIMAMQVKALQDGIVETNRFNRIIKQQNKKILAADKVKTEFLSNVSHELRSPLNSIIGFSDLLISGITGELNPKQTEYVNDIQTAGIHLLGMVNEILDISKIESHAIQLNLSYFDINLCLFEVLNILKPLYTKKNLSLQNIVPPETMIYADYQKVQQIFFNILSNAIKFTNENGLIKISAKITKKYLTISIQDNGIGIEKKNQKRIFKKFEQINSEKISNMNSTGLGLTITKELVKLHNGNIKLESELNQGSVFHVKLPLKNNSCQN